MRRVACIGLISLGALALGLVPSARAEDPGTTTAPPPLSAKAPKQDVAPTTPKGPQVVSIDTSMGLIKVELDAAKAPITIDNFMKYVKAGYYSGTVFHRVIDGFMIQGGGFTEDMKQKAATYPPIKLESQNGLKNARGTLAMARTSDPNSATSQFFINVVDNPRLDHPNPDGNGYAVFGKVIEGLEVVDKIKAVKTGTKAQMQNVPLEAVLIKSITVVGETPAAAATPAAKTE